MSANLDLGRSIYAPQERGDFSSAGWADPQIELVYADGPMPGPWTGPAAMAQAWREFLSGWDDYRVDVEEYRELDAERVLVLLRAGGRGRRSGMQVEQISSKAANILHIHDGKVTRLIAYWHREHALADLGLASEGDAR